MAIKSKKPWLKIAATLGTMCCAAVLAVALLAPGAGLSAPSPASDTSSAVDSVEIHDRQWTAPGSSSDESGAASDGEKGVGDSGSSKRDAAAGSATKLLTGAEGTKYPAGQVNLVCDEDMNLDALAGQLEDAGVKAQSMETVPVSGGLLVNVTYEGEEDPETLGKRLSGEGIVQSAQPNYVATLSEVEDEAEILRTVDDPYQSWYTTSNVFHPSFLKATGAETAWDTATSDGNVTVAVIDTGVDYSHPDLAANLVDAQYAVCTSTDAEKFTDGGWVYPSGADAVADVDSHGTHVAGIVAAQADNGIGMAGISFNAKVLSVNAFTPPVSSTDRGGLYTTDLIQAIDYIISVKNDPSSPPELQNIRVVNMSLGLYADDEAFGAAVQRLVDEGILVCAAAGNSGTAKVSYPAGYAGVMGVGSVDIKGTADQAEYGDKSSFSNHNASVDITAPGDMILSTVPLSYSSFPYGGKGGTSMASPMVAGAAALLFAADSSLTATQVERVLEGSALDLGDTGRDDEYGYGALCLDQAMLRAINADMNKLQVTLESEQVGYTGAAQEPSVKVAYGETAFKQNTDYTVSYQNNVEIGEATVTVTGKGALGGSVQKKFTIASQDVSALTCKAADQTYTGEALEPKVQVDSPSGTLVEGKAYTVEFANNVNVGQATATVTGSGGNTGSATCPFAIKPADISAAKVTVADTTFDGQAATPEVTVTWNGKTLEAGVDYQVSYQSNDAPGQGTAMVTGMGNFTGSASGTFALYPRSNDISISKPATQYYLGSALTPKLTVSCQGVTYVQGRDYQVTYLNNNAQGTATVQVKGIAPYTFEGSVTFTIAAAKVGQSFAVSGSTYKVTKAGSAPEVSLTKVPSRTSSYTIASSVKVGNVHYAVTGLYASVFKGHKYLTSVNTNRVKSIPSYAFYKCPKLKYVTIGNKATSVGKYAFYKCPRLYKVTVGAGVKTIGYKAFYGCGKLKTVYLKTKYLSKSRVGSKAFSGTYRYATVHCYSKVKSYAKWLPSKGFKSGVKYRK